MKIKLPHMGTMGGREVGGREGEGLFSLCQLGGKAPCGSHPWLPPFPPPRPCGRDRQCCWKCEVTSGLTPAFGSRIFCRV